MRLSPDAGRDSLLLLLMTTMLALAVFALLFATGLLG